MIGPVAGALLVALATDSVPRAAGVRISEPEPRRMSPVLDSSLGHGPLQPDSVQAGLARAVDRAVARGFLVARAGARGASWSDSGPVLELQADPGRRFRWGGVRDAGGTRLSSEALGRLSGLPSGEVADPADMASARSRLLSTGYVEEESPPRPVMRTGSSLVDMLVHLHDRPSSSVEAAAGWTKGGSTSGYVEISLLDILGTARDLEFGISNGSSGTVAHGMWKEPWIGSLDLQLRLEGNLAQDTLARSLEGSAEAGWISRDGSWEIALGLLAGRRAELAPGDTVFGPDLDEWGSRLSASWRSEPPSAWPVDAESVRGRVEGISASADTGSSHRLRASAHVEIFRPAGPLVVRLGGDARGVWPLDASAGLSEALAPGGIGGWRGWPEGSPRTPAWAWGIAELRIGSARSGGVVAFAEPGVRALRRQDLSWRPEPGISWGGGATLSFPGWVVELAVAARNDTRDWTESLLQVRAINRF